MREAHKPAHLVVGHGRRRAQGGAHRSEQGIRQLVSGRKGQPERR
jgi:hypothetical protein